MITLSQALYIFLVALLTVLSKFLISFLNSKTQEAKEKTDNELAKKYLDMINTTVTTCVIATNQTYVEALKNKDLFDVVA